jgi:hypothetical protein
MNDAKSSNDTTCYTVSCRYIRVIFTSNYSVLLWLKNEQEYFLHGYVRSVTKQTMYKNHIETICLNLGKNIVLLVRYTKVTNQKINLNRHYLFCYST